MIPQTVRNAFLAPRSVTRVTPMPGGLSGAFVYRCDGPTPLALKRWPKSTDVRRVRHVHQVIQQASLECSLLPQCQQAGPNGSTSLVDGDGFVWELTNWIQGRVVPPDASIAHVQRGAEAIADVHVALKRQGSWMQPSPGIAERLEVLQKAQRWLPNALRTDLSGRVHPTVQEPLSAAIRLLTSRWPAAAAKIEANLLQIRQRPVPTQYVLRDIHRENALFSTETSETPEITVSGIIDFDAIRIDTPALDLSRWVTSFLIYGRDPSATLECILAAYLSRAPLSDGTDASELRRLVGSIGEASAWISLVNWVRWLVVESRQFPDFQCVAQRLRRLVDLQNDLSLSRYGNHDDQ